MTRNRAALRQSASQQQSDLASASQAGHKVEMCGVTGGEPAECGEKFDPDASSIIPDEVLRHRIRTLIEEKPKSSSLNRLLDHSLITGLILAVVGFALTGIVGSVLTDYYAAKQLELTSRRSFSDELNKIRVQKVGEVWEQIDKNEIALDDLLVKANKETGSNVEIVNDLRKIVDEDILVINKNRFWLGETLYKETLPYMAVNEQIVSGMLLGAPGTNLKDLIKKREGAKQDIIKVRDKFFKGEL